VKRKITTVLFLLLFLSGLSLLLYPTVSNYWNAKHTTEAVSSYREAADALTDAQYEGLLSAAKAYNTDLSGKEQEYALSDAERQRYEELLNPGGTGMMGYIKIPAIDVTLPIYHGTGEAVLQTSVGHLDWTSLPVGGESTHAVLSGHRGLPSARLFTDLDKLTVGDFFTVTVLDQTVTYEVYQIETVDPEQTDALKIREGEDLCTLVTCTPYGINTHRLLVHGRRVENAKEQAHITAEAVQIEPVMVMPFVAFPLLPVAFMPVNRAENKKEWDEGADIDEKG